MKNFEYWSNTLLAGCDGSDKDLEDSKIWVCGIEYGLSEKESADYYQKDLKNQINQSNTLNYRTRDFQWSDHVKYRYGWSMAKLITSILIKDDVSDISSICKELCKNDKLPSIFKANLFPIAFNSTNHDLWHGKKLDEVTGFENKYLYETWCFFNRLPVFSAKVKEYKPRLIIGTGVSYLQSFIAFSYGFNGISFDLHKGALDNQGGKPRDYYFLDIKHNTDQVTTLFVVPFLSGVHGLNSDYLLKEMGKKIQSSINLEFL